LSSRERAAGSEPRRRQTRKSDACKIEGLAIALEGLVKEVTKENYLVKSRGTKGKHVEVRWDGRKWTCKCPDAQQHVICQHIHAVSFAKNRLSVTQGQNETLCPRCDSSPSFHVRKGIRNNKYGLAQTYLCTVCGLRFVHRLGFQKMRCNPIAVVASLDLFYKGLSLSKISSHLEDFYNVQVTPVTVHNWIKKYVALIKKHTARLRPTVSTRWHADETEVKVNGKYAYMWNVMDSKTRFLVAKVLSFRRGSREATKLLTQALNRTAKEPSSLVTDGLKSYGAAIDAKRKEGSMRSTAHHASGLQDAKNNRMERMHGTVKERTKLLRGLHDIRSGRLFMDGLETYYNYVRPHLALNGGTPAESAGIGLRGRNKWLSLITAASKADVRRRRRRRPSTSNHSRLSASD